MPRNTVATTLPDRIFASLKQDILACRLYPGEPLNEEKVAKRFKASRTPLREACNRLANEGLLVSVPNKGFFVAPITMKDIASLYQVRLIVESAVAGLAARTITAGGLEELGGLVEIEREQQAGAVNAEVIDHNLVFHVTLARATRNDRLVNLTRSLLEQSSRFDHLLLSMYPADWGDWSDWTEHAAIVESLRARDAHQSRQAMARHIQIAEERMFKIFTMGLVPEE